MQMLYNSEQFAVVQFESAPEAPRAAGGYEIVDKLHRREIYLAGDLAQRFREQVDALVQQQPTTEAIDEFLSGFSGWMSQPLTLH